MILNRHKPYQLILFVGMCLSTFVVQGDLFAQNDEDRRYKLALGYEKNGDIASAARIFGELYAADNESRVYFDAVKRTYLQLRNVDKLLRLVSERIERYPGDQALGVLHAELLYQSRREEEAHREWERVIALHPDQQGTYFLVGESYVKVRLFSEAARVYERGKKVANGQLAYTDRLARIYSIIGQYDKASEEYLELLRTSPNRLSYVKNGMSLLTGTPDGVDTAIEATRRFVEGSRDKTVYLNLLSWLYSEKGDDRAAFDVAVRLDDLRKAKGSNIFAFTDRMMNEEKYEIAIHAYKYFLDTYAEDNPLRPSVLYNYVRALQVEYGREGLLSKEQAEELIGQYEQVLTMSLGGTLGAKSMIQIARLQADVLNSPDDALKTLQNARMSYRFPSQAEALLYEGDLSLRLGELAEARRLYTFVVESGEKTSEISRLKSTARLRMAEMVFYSGDFKAAVDAFTKLTENTSDIATNDALSYLFLLQENLDGNDAALKEYATGMLKIAQRDWEGGLRYMGEAARLGQNSSLAGSALYHKGGSLIELQRYDEAVEVLLTIVETYPDGTNGDAALFKAAEVVDKHVDDTARALELYTKVLVEFPLSQYAAPARKRIRSLRLENNRGGS